MDPSDAWTIILLIVLLFLSAFFSSAETALTTVGRMKIRSLAEEGNKKAVTVSRLLKDPTKMLSAILICNNVVNLSASSISIKHLRTEYATSLECHIIQALLQVLQQV